MPRYSWDTDSLTDVVVLHTDFQLPDVLSTRSDLSYYNSDDSLIIDIMNIPGIEYAALARDFSGSSAKYKARFCKGRLFSWDAIKPAIIAILGKRYGDMVDAGKIVPPVPDPVSKPDGPLIDPWSGHARSRGDELSKYR